jgi:DNA-directed RNA polymerase subunit L
MKGVPVQFVNAIRRVLLNETPTVVLGGIQIHTNTTRMPHEMLQLRTELLPVNVRTSEEDLLRSAKLTLRINAEEDVRVYSSDFVVEGSRTDVLMLDRDLGTPLFFLKMKKGEAVHVTAGLRVEQGSSHCCVATYSYHVDADKVDAAREAYIAENKSDPNGYVFDNSHRQLVYHKNEKGRPDWFDVTVESIGVIPARELVKDALATIKKNTIEWSRSDIIREKETNAYMVISDIGGITVSALVQAVLYESGLCSFVSYDRLHPLRTETTVRFLTERTPEEIMAFVVAKVTEYCDTATPLL